MFKKTILIASISGVFLAPLSAQEATEAPATEAPASNPALDAILEHVPAILDNTWQSTFHVKAFEGEEQKMDLTAAVRFQDKMHFSVDLDLTVEDDFEGEKIMSFTVLADGTFLYLDSPNMAEVSQGMASGPVKVEMALFEKMVSSQMGGMAGGGEMDKDALKGVLQEALAEFTFREEGSNEEVRRFILKNDDVDGSISFHKKHWFLHSADMSFDEGTMNITTSDNGMVEGFPEGAFTFTVAEGQSVMDLTPMIQMSMPQEEASDDDLEF
ncbi:MAG: hypothetical protein ACYTEP_01625 [Planctomycetota bacterium]|jgi:outer membrane lipoprotein-sorting protein